MPTNLTISTRTLVIWGTGDGAFNTDLNLGGMHEFVKDMTVKLYVVQTDSEGCTADWRRPFHRKSHSLAKACISPLQHEPPPAASPPPRVRYDGIDHWVAQVAPARVAKDIKTFILG